MSPLPADTVIATLGQTLSGTYSPGNGEFSACTYDYVRTLDWSAVATTSSRLSYYQNLNCKIFLYRAAVDRVGGVYSGSYNASVDLGLSMSGVTNLHLLCGFVEGKYPAGYTRDVSNGLIVTTGNNQQFVEADYTNGSWGHVAFHFLGGSDSTDLCYAYEIENIYDSSANDISFSTMTGCVNTDFPAEAGYIYFYIVSPVVNDDVLLSGGGGTNVDIDVIVGDIKDIMSDNNGILSQIYNFVVTIPETILDGIQALFIPTEEDLEGFKDDADDLLHETFGGLYDAEEMVHDGLSDIPSNSKSTITFPGITVSEFSLPAQEVPIRPAGFDYLFDTLATVIDIIATFAFLNMLKHKLSKILGGGADE